MAKLSKVIKAPRIQCTLPCENQSYATLRYLKVEDVKLVDAFHSVWRIELTKDAFAPNE